MASPKVCLLGRNFPNHDQEPYQREGLQAGQGGLGCSSVGWG